MNGKGQLLNEYLLLSINPYLCALFLLQMAGIHPKTLQDLEFPTVLQQVSARCRTEHGKALALEIAPFTEEELIVEQLGQTAEYLSSFVSENHTASLLRGHR